jgi:hypothetical protein
MELGARTDIPFTGSKYESVYDCLKALMVQLEDNSYHRRKHVRLLKTIAHEGRSVTLVLIVWHFIDLITGCSAHLIVVGIWFIPSSLDWIRRAVISSRIYTLWNKLWYHIAECYTRMLLQSYRRTTAELQENYAKSMECYCRATAELQENYAKSTRMLPQSYQRTTVELWESYGRATVELQKSYCRAMAELL